MSVQPLAELALRIPRFDDRNGALPVEVARVDRPIELFAVHPRDRPVATLPLRIDIGPLDLASALSGFHASETNGETTARWTTAEAQVAVPRLATGPGMPGMLVIRAAVSRPGNVPLPELALSFDGQSIGRVHAWRPAFDEYVFDVPAPAIARMASGGVLTLNADVFVPAEHERSGDRRTLGVMVDWIEIRQAARR
jgi:hypothetical protein